MPPSKAYSWKIIVRTLEGERKTFQATEGLVGQARKAQNHCVEINLPGYQRRSILRFCLMGDHIAYFREIGLERPPRGENPAPLPPTRPTG